MEESKREKFYFEKDEYGKLTGLTIYNLDGVLGFASCYPGRVDIQSNKTKDGQKQVVITELSKADCFNKKVGKEVAKGRAEKLSSLLAQGLDETTAFEKLYSGRMKTRIREYAEREILRQSEKEETQVDSVVETLQVN